MRGQRLQIVICLAPIVAGCIQGKPGEGGRSERVIERYVSTAETQPAHRMDAIFEGKVELLGYDLEPAEPTPGESLKITWHWHSLEKLGRGWELFTHLVEADSGRMIEGGNFDRASQDGLRNAYPPSRWEPGQYIRDAQRLTLPEKITHPQVELRIGVFQNSRRLRITSGPSDSSKRARGPRFSTGYEPPPIAELTIPFSPGAITVDGNLDDSPWSQAATISELVRATNAEPDGPLTKVRMLYDKTSLYVGFECEDEHLQSTFSRRDDELWKQDAVEIFIDPAGSGRDYLEYQVSPKGIIFDTKVLRHPQRDDSFDGQATAAATFRGTLNNASDSDEGWTAEIAIPFAALNQEPPQAGDQWRLNIFRLDSKRGGGRAFLSWSSPLANTTHIPDRFGKIIFGPRSTDPSNDSGLADSTAPEAP